MSKVPQGSQSVHMLDLLNCPKCGGSNAVGTRYCSTCGASLEGVVATKAMAAEGKKGLLGRIFGKRDEPPHRDL